MKVNILGSIHTTSLDLKYKMYNVAQVDFLHYRYLQWRRVHSAKVAMYNWLGAVCQ